MGKRRNPRGNAANNQPSPAASQKALPAQPVPIPPTIPVWNKVISFVFHEKTIAVLALAISVGAVWYAREQTHTSQEQTRAAQEQTRIAQHTLDIATGKRQAKIEPAEFYPTKQDFPESEVQPWGKEGVKRAIFKSANKMVVYSPAIFFNNVGDEPIDAIRIEVNTPPPKGGGFG